MPDEIHGTDLFEIIRTTRNAAVEIGPGTQRTDPKESWRRVSALPAAEICSAGGSW
jgi:hypothetical protein